MDRRALAQRNRKPQGNNVTPDMALHAVHKENVQKSNAPLEKTLKESSNSTGPGIAKGECTTCLKAAICVCQRCGDFYCSPECQRKDWPRHRYICFPVPPLVHPLMTASTDALYPVNNPLLTVNQIPNVPLGSQQNVLYEMFNLNLGMNNLQFQQNWQNQNRIMNGLQQHPYQQHGQSNSKVSPQNANKVQKSKEPTATVPVAELPKTNSRVILTGLRTPNRCYIRALSSEEDDDYLLNARKIDSYGKNAAPLSKIPKALSYAIAPLQGIMYRVQVQIVRNPDNIRVLFIDRGILATRRLSELREINDEILSLKQHTCLIPLRNVSNYVLNEKLAKQFNSFENLEFQIKYDRVEDGVELLYWQTGKSLNDEIEQLCKVEGAQVWADSMRSKQENEKKNKKNEKNANSEETKNKKCEPQNSVGKVVSAASEHDDQFYATNASTQNSTVNSQTSMGQEQSKQPKNDVREQNKEEEVNAKVKVVKTVEKPEEPTMIAPFQTHYFKVGCPPFKAIVLDVSCLEIGYIGCIDQNDLSCLQTVHQQLSSIDVSDKPYEPKMDEYCIAKFEDMWYRAQVTDIPDKSHYTVMYIDFTNEATLTSADIRHYPADVTNACKTNLCLIDGLPSNFSDALTKFLNEEISIQSSITIDSVNKIDEQVVIIECKSLLEKIRKNNLLT
ncbi:uncharacterized protein LOC128855822 [Anastrepha ludens]|uniref:uncharacterized protein LOC128855822 n=1 Tax=Anastrepha ludens TaxID=28586 RepID=UPI0023AFEA11|nr:uncharacterized protein LOC128855822 [Anastrepha ludens]